MDVAKVWKPMGLNINVAGNSFIVSKKTRAAPDTMPGRTNGRVTDENTPKGVRPNPLAASSTLGLTCKKELRAAPTAAETNSTT